MVVMALGLNLPNPIPILLVASPNLPPSPNLPGPSPNLPAPSPNLPGPSPNFPAPSPNLPGPSPNLPTPSPNLPSPSASLPAPSTCLSAIPSRSSSGCARLLLALLVSGLLTRHFCLTRLHFLILRWRPGGPSCSWKRQDEQKFYA